MVPFGYSAAPNANTAIARVAAVGGAEFIAGGTDMLQLLQEGVRAPSELVDINALPLRGIERRPAEVRIGALTRMAEVETDPLILELFPAVAQALLASAAPQIRNMASIGGNLLQRTRCLYFRDVTTPCNKREPGAGCAAQDGQNRYNALFGGSEDCIATHASDLAVALVALDASVETDGPRGGRMMRLVDLYRLPRDTPHIETVLVPGELITAVSIPIGACAQRSYYLKVRERASFEWALVSAAVGLDLAGGQIREARVAVGGVATKPWRLPEVERALVGGPPLPETFREAAAAAGEGAVARRGNVFKFLLLRRTVERALLLAGGFE